MTIAKTLTALTLAATVAGCAQQPDQVQAAFVSPTGYSGMSCAQLNAEARTINQRLTTATAAQQSAASSDAAMTAVALVLFWPAAFAIQGDKGSTAELSRLKGEAAAVQSAATRKGC